MSKDKIDDINTSDVCPKDENDRRCAAGLTFESGSCMRLKLLCVFAQAYNKENKNTAIKLYPNYEILNPRKYKKYLIREFNKRFDNASQRTWFKHKFVKNMELLYRDEIEKYTFRPNGPNGRFEWLNTLNIDDVMEQYEVKYPEFKFLGTVPMDFDDLPYLKINIKNLDYQDLVNTNKTKLGIVFNLDDSTESGSHWVSMYANLKTGEVYYFDSYGTEPENRVQKLMRRISIFCKEHMGIKDLKVDYNKIQHQRENSECGIYSMNFILRLLKGDSFETICKSKIPDKQINKCRNVYFNNVKI